MFALIEYPAGNIIEAVVLHMDDRRARLVAAGRSDAWELKKSGQDWLNEAGEKIAFEFLLSDAPSNDSTVLPVPEVAARAAGSFAF